jgi:hypothetical protein
MYGMKSKLGTRTPMHLARLHPCASEGCMMFGQLSNRDSLSDLCLTINAHTAKFYHLGFGKSISKPNLAKTNEKRDWHIYQEYACHLIDTARKICLSEKENSFSFSNAVYAFDSTTIDLCLSVFCCATFRRAKGAVKLHTQYDVRTSIPVFIDVTAASQFTQNILYSHKKKLIKEFLDAFIFKADLQKQLAHKYKKPQAHTLRFFYLLAPWHKQTLTPDPRLSICLRLDGEKKERHLLHH